MHSLVRKCSLVMRKVLHETGSMQGGRTFYTKISEGPTWDNNTTNNNNVIYTIILLMDSVPHLTSPHLTSVALIFGLYRPSSGPIALRNV